MQKNYTTAWRCLKTFLFSSIVFAASAFTTAPISKSKILNSGGLTTWTGTQSEKWFDQDNWSDGIPTAATNAIIPAVGGSVIYAPIIDAGDATVSNIQILNGGKLTVKGDGILLLYGVVANAGSLDLIDGTIDLAAPGVELAGNSIEGNTVKNIRISAGGSVALTAGAGLVNVTGKVYFHASDNTFNTNDNLVLTSTDNSTASVYDITNGGDNGTVSGNNIVGRVTVEKFIATPRKWQFLSADATYANVGQSTTIQDLWMEGQSVGQNNGKPGYGMWVTGVGGQPNFDASTTTPSIKYWTGNAYQGITGYNADIHLQSAYMAFVRGDRSCTGANTNATKTILRTTGSLNQGYFPSATGWIDIPAGNVVTAVGNPYASTIYLNKLITTVDPTEPLTIYVWDPKLVGANGVGGFQTLSGTTAEGFLITPGYGSYGVTPGADVYMNTIESGQAFFIQPTEKPLSIRFQEAMKTPFAHTVSFAAESEEVLKGVLFNSAAGMTALDGMMVRFGNSYNSDVNRSDAKKMANTAENISVRSHNSLLAVEYRKPVATADTIQLNMTGMRANIPYQWKFSAKNMNKPGRQAVLVDRYTHTETPIALTGETNYSFTVEFNGQSDASNRFLIVFNTIPVTNATARTGTMSISPNPVDGRTANLYFEGQPAGKYTLTTTDMNGRVVMTKGVEIRTDKAVQRINLPLSTVAGNYRATITNAEGRSSTVFFVVN